MKYFFISTSIIFSLCSTHGAVSSIEKNKHLIFSNEIIQETSEDIKNFTNYCENQKVSESTCLQNTTILQNLSNDIQKIWSENEKSIVKVLGEKIYESNKQLLYGTGFFISDEGYILTTATVATEASNLWIEFQGLSYAANCIGKDHTTNLAVLKVAKCPKDFQCIQLPKSNLFEHKEIGALIISIGCALGMSPAPSLGMISGENLYYGNNIFVTTYIRSNIEICGGESGAPVFDCLGNFCGILIASLPEIRSSFIIPSCALNRIVEPILSGENVNYCAVGFGARGQISDSGEKEIVISSVPAKNNFSNEDDILIGDIVFAIDGFPVKTEDDIANLLFFKQPNEDVYITIQRKVDNNLIEKTIKRISVPVIRF